MIPNSDPPAAPDPAAAPPETPWTAEVLDRATGAFTADWQTKVPATEAEMWKEYKDSKSPFEALQTERQRRIDAQTALRTKSDKAAGLPPKPEGDAATPDALAEYYKARNLPGTAEAYGLVKPADLPPELWNDVEAAGYAKLFHELELPKEKTDKLTAYTQANARQAWATHQAAVAAKVVADAKERADYIQAQKETLHQNHGINVDRDLKTLTKLGAVSGLDPEMLNPDNPDKWIGSDVVKAMMSIVAMNPKSGDPTGRMLGRAGGSEHKDVAYFKNLKEGDDDLNALRDSRHPRHSEILQKKQEAYDRDIALREQRR